MSAEFSRVLKALGLMPLALKRALHALIQPGSVGAFSPLATATLWALISGHDKKGLEYRVATRLSQSPRFAAALSEETIALLFKSAPLHDVGKVAIPDAILLKPGKLTDDEWVIMKKHSSYGRDALV